MKLIFKPLFRAPATILPFFCFTLLSVNLAAQIKIAPEVTACAGTEKFSNDTLVMNWPLGQFAKETFFA